MKWQLLWGIAALATAVKTNRQQGPVAQIVDMLKGMSEKSEADGKAETETFEKFQCQSTKSIEGKGTALSELGKLISATENRLEKLKALKAELKAKAEEVEEDLKAKEATEVEAVSERENEHASFTKQEAEMSTNLASLEKALAELGDLNAKPKALLPSTEPGILAATRHLEAVAEEAKSFLGKQVALRGANYEQQSGVLGTLLSVRDTYKEDLQELRATEESQGTGHKKLLKQLKSEQVELSKLLEMAKAKLGSTEEEMASRLSQLEKAKKDLDSESALKAKEERLLAQKAAAFEERKELRAEEAKAIAEAVAVLNSGAVAFGRRSSLLQLPVSAAALLRAAAGEARSARLAHAAALARGAPLEKAISEIQAMRMVIVKEGKADERKSEWCGDAPRLGQSKSKQMETLEGAISELDGTIKSPVDGLEVSLLKAQDDLKRNEADQEEVAALRKSESKTYRKKVMDLQEAQQLLKRARMVLKQFYSKLELIQAPMQSGSEVLELLMKVSEDAAMEEAKAVRTEEEAQASFEETAQMLRDAEEQLQKTVTDTRKEIADAKTLKEKRELYKETAKEKASLEEYLADVKPGCAWLRAKLPQREANRKAEAKSLTEAMKLIEGVPPAA